jgi:hypothetical protein
MVQVTVLLFGAGSHSDLVSRIDDKSNYSEIPIGVQTMIDQPATVRLLHDEIVAILERMKKPARLMNMLIKHLEKKPPEEIQKIYDFTCELYHDEFMALKEVWTLPHISDTMWHSYKLLRIRGLPEQESLRVAWDRFFNKLYNYHKQRRAERKANEDHTASDSKRIRNQSLRRKRAAIKSNSGCEQS